MAKDPAFLFYPNDWLGGTRHLSFEAKGAYIDLLILQFNIGPFTLEDAKQILGSSWDNLWVSLKRKFTTDGDGTFWNERLRIETEKRHKHIEHQRVNGSKGGRPKNPIKTQPLTQTEPKQKPLENENENENVLVTLNSKNKASTKERKKGIQAHHFKDSPYFEKSSLAAALFGTIYQDANIGYYHESALNWSDSLDKNKKSDWLATIKGFMLRDMKEGKFAVKASATDPNKKMVI